MKMPHEEVESQYVIKSDICLRFKDYEVLIAFITELAIVNRNILLSWRKTSIRLCKCVIGYPKTLISVGPI